MFHSVRNKRYLKIMQQGIFFMQKRHSLFLVLALGSTLAACGGSSSDNSPAPPPPVAAPPPAAPAPLAGGRLIYSLDGVNDTLKMFDETVASNRFTGTTVSAVAGAQLVLSNDGLTLAMLEGDSLSVVSAGLEHLEDDTPRTEAPRIESAAPISSVSMVVATMDHFSVLRADGTGLLLEAADGEETGDVWTDLVYPTLALDGGQFLIFTANAVNPADTDLTVVNADGSTGENGLIWMRPNATGFFAESLTCADGVEETTQTERFTVALCGDGTLRWLASGWLAPPGHPAAGQTIHASQRYPETANRREGADGELPAGGSAFIENISGLAMTRSEENVIAAWAGDQLWLVNLHSDHTHRLLVNPSLPENTNIIAVAAATVDDAVTVLSDTGVASTFRFMINASANPEVIDGMFYLEQLGSASANWTAERSHMVAGPYDFYVINRDTGTLYHIDSHDPDDEYHLHATLTQSDLGDAFSAVFAHVIEDGHGHDHN
jgi:hypothetical protein